MDLGNISLKMMCRTFGETITLLEFLYLVKQPFYILYTFSLLHVFISYAFILSFSLLQGGPLPNFIQENQLKLFEQKAYRNFLNYMKEVAGNCLCTEKYTV